MKRLTYVELSPMPRSEVLAALDSDPSTCATAVVSAALFDEVAFVESVVMTASAHDHPIVRGAAMIAISHLARLHKNAASTRRLIVQLAKGLLDEDREVRGKAGDAADDIDVFIPSLVDEVARARCSVWTESMRGVTVRSRGDSLTFDLVEVLEAIGDDAATSLWTCTNVECSGGEGAAALHRASDCGDVLLGSALLELARDVDQTIDGVFSGARYGEDEPWLRIRAVDNSAFDVESTRPSVLERVRARFEIVEDLP